MSQLSMWEDDTPAVLPVRPSIISTPTEMPDAWLWTGRYQNKAIATFDMAAIRTTLGHPRFRLGYLIAANLQELAPSRAMFHMTDVGEFRAAYRAKLEAVGYDVLMKRLRELHAEQGRPLVLLCYERPGEHCHRFVLARWFEKNGVIVPELRE